MNPAAYLEMAETESRHWWFCGRRAILTRMLQSLDLPANASILELGCGTGGNLAMLGEFGTVSALEMDDTARSIAADKTGNRFQIRAGHCPDNIPFSANSFDLVCMFDVLEHIEQDTTTLESIKPLLKKHGRLLLTVPAYQWLYGAHDEFLHHKRRYSASELQQKIAAAGLHCTRFSYFNTLLFPLAVIARLKDKLFGGANPTGTSVPPSLVNRLFHSVFAFERFLLKRFDLPFGVSLLCILEVVDER